tara:strand:- start:1074 stop:4286 length:3213 start_codon:yes stop_codon:yes gene_type:complete
VYADGWQRGPNNISPHAVRQLKFVHALYGFDEWWPSASSDGHLVGGNYSVLIFAPGPGLGGVGKPLTLLRKLTKTMSTPVTILAGITLCPGPGSALAVSMSDLVLFRESLSLRLNAARGSKPSSTRMLLSGDFSFSFESDRVLLDFWARHYRQLLLSRFGQREPWHLLFIRSASHLSAETNTTHFQLEVSDCTTSGSDGQGTNTIVLEKARTLLASSDLTPKGDGQFLLQMQERFGFSDDQIVRLEVVEQMLGLMGCCGSTLHRASRSMSVISDRYHPAMAAHRVGAAVKLIGGPALFAHSSGQCAQTTKLRGACQMISTYDAEAMRGLNDAAWSAMRQTIARKSPPSASHVPAPDGDLFKATCGSVTHKHKAEVGRYAKALAVLQTPTPERPLAFFHFRKTGGQRLRLSLRKDAIAHNVSYFIPCWNNVPCETYAPLSRLGAPRYSILAGHLHYSSVEMWLYASTELLGPKIWSRQSTRIGESSERHASRELTCLVMMRPTVDRVRSCWNYRLVEERYYRLDGRRYSIETSHSTLRNSTRARFQPAHKISGAEAKRVLPLVRDMHGSGCNNEALRMLSPIGVRCCTQTLCAALKPLAQKCAAPLTCPRLLLWCVQSDELQVNALTQENPIAPGLLDETLSRMSHCVVGMIDRCSETMEVLSFFLPWMRYNCTANEDRILDTRVKGLPEDVAKAFLHFNALDEYVFRFGSKLFDAQLKEARKAREKLRSSASCKNKPALVVDVITITNSVSGLGQWIDFLLALRFSRVWLYEDGNSSAMSRVASEYGQRVRHIPFAAQAEAERVKRNASRAFWKRGFPSQQVMLDDWPKRCDLDSSCPQWVTYIDPDEYIYLPRGQDIAGFLLQENPSADVGAVCLPRFEFGTSGHIELKESDILRSLVHRWPQGVRGKCFAHVPYLKGLEVHAVKHSAKLTKCIGRLPELQTEPVCAPVYYNASQGLRAYIHHYGRRGSKEYLLQDISRLRNFDAALHKDIQSAGCEQYYDSEEPDKNRACLRLFERGFAIKDMTGALRQGFQGFPGSALIPWSSEGYVFDDSLAHRWPRSKGTCRGSD